MPDPLPRPLDDLTDVLPPYLDAVRRWRKTRSATARRDERRTAPPVVVSLDELAASDDAPRGLRQLMALLNLRVAAFLLALALFPRGPDRRERLARRARRWHELPDYDDSWGQQPPARRGPQLADVAALLEVDVADLEEAVALGLISFKASGPCVPSGLLPAILDRAPSRPRWRCPPADGRAAVVPVPLAPELKEELDSYRGRQLRARQRGAAASAANLTRHIIVECGSEQVVGAQLARLAELVGPALLEVDVLALAAYPGQTQELEVEVALRDAVVVVRVPDAEAQPCQPNPFMDFDDFAADEPAFVRPFLSGRLGVVVWLTVRPASELPDELAARVVPAPQPPIAWRRRLVEQLLPKGTRLPAEADGVIAQIPVDELRQTAERLCNVLLDRPDPVLVPSADDIRAARHSSASVAPPPPTPWIGNADTFEQVQRLRISLEAVERGAPEAQTVLKFLGVGARVILLHGPPGTGKTLLGRWLGHWLDRPVLVHRPADILGMYVGQSEQNLAAAFSDARDLGGIPLIDEVDSYAAPRGGAHARPWTDSLTNQLLQSLETHDGPVVFTTNRSLAQLDGAFLRRCGHKLEIPPPDRNARARLWEAHLDALGLDGPIDFDTLAAAAPLHGGHVANCVQRAALAAVAERRLVRQEDLLREARAELPAGPRGGPIGFFRADARS